MALLILAHAVRIAILVSFAPFPMSKAFPIRAESHQLEELSQRFFVRCLPKNWTCDKPGSDYGVDLRVDLFEGNLATGLELLIQLKASAKGSDGEHAIARLKISTYNLLWDKLQVAMLVKYVEAENEAYWLLLRDVPVPNQDNESFSVHIPKKNKLSAIAWPTIQGYIRDVTNRKVAAMRKHQLEALK